MSERNSENVSKCTVGRSSSSAFLKNTTVELWCVDRAKFSDHQRLRPSVLLRFQ